MAYEHKPGRFSLFRNKKTKDNAPDWKGEGLDSNGKQIKLSVWIKETSAGQILSGSIEYKESGHKPVEQSKQTKPTPKPDFDDDVPF